MLKGKSLLEHTNLFSPNDYEKNNNSKILSITKKMKTYITLFVVYIENLKNLKYLTS